MENLVANDPEADVNIIRAQNDLVSKLKNKSAKISWDNILENLTYVSRIITCLEKINKLFTKFNFLFCIESVPMIDKLPQRKKFLRQFNSADGRKNLFHGT